MPAIPIIGAVATVAGTAQSIRASNAASAAQAASNRRASAAQAEQQRIEEERLAMQRQQYAELMDRSRQAWGQFQTNVLPNIINLNKEAGNVQADYAGVQNRAAADVNRAFDNTGAAIMREDQRRGINPSAGNAAEMARQNAIDRAAAVAQARTGARTAETNRVASTRYQQMLGAIGAAQPLYGVAQAVPNVGISGSGLGNVAGEAQTSANAYGNSAAYADSLARGNAQELFRSGGALDTIFNHAGSTPAITRVSNPLPDPSTLPQPTGTDGTIPGMRDGGLIRGPGTGTSDSVMALINGRKPLHVSDGEYIVPADVVDKIGKEFFDSMLAKLHKPAIERMH